MGTVMQEHHVISFHMDRKTKKPLMEKRRRARINSCLTELKSLLLTSLENPSVSGATPGTPSPAAASKLEKADILELTVHLLRSRERSRLLADATSDPSGSTLAKFSTGWTQCASQVAHYANSVDGFRPDLKDRLMTHLQRCYAGIEATQAAITGQSGGGRPHSLFSHEGKPHEQQFDEKSQSEQQRRQKEQQRQRQQQQQQQQQQQRQEQHFSVRTVEAPFSRTTPAISTQPNEQRPQFHPIKSERAMMQNQFLTMHRPKANTADPPHTSFHPHPSSSTHNDKTHYHHQLQTTPHSCDVKQSNSVENGFLPPVNFANLVPSNALTPLPHPCSVATASTTNTLVRNTMNDAVKGNHFHNDQIHSDSSTDRLAWNDSTNNGGNNSASKTAWDTSAITPRRINLIRNQCKPTVHLPEKNGFVRPSLKRPFSSVTPATTTSAVPHPESLMTGLTKSELHQTAKRALFAKPLEVSRGAIHHSLLSIFPSRAEFPVPIDNLKQTGLTVTGTNMNFISPWDSAETTAATCVTEITSTTGDNNGNDDDDDDDDDFVDIENVIDDSDEDSIVGDSKATTDSNLATSGANDKTVVAVGGSQGTLWRPW